jgi:hypothetical protein
MYHQGRKSDCSNTCEGLTHKVIITQRHLFCPQHACDHFVYRRDTPRTAVPPPRQRDDKLATERSNNSDRQDLRAAVHASRKPDHPGTTAMQLKMVQVGLTPLSHLMAQLDIRVGGPNDSDKAGAATQRRQKYNETSRWT